MPRGTVLAFHMPTRFRTLKNLAEDTATTLRRVKDAQREGSFLLRRFKNTDSAHIAGLETLFRELAALPPTSVEPVIEHGTDILNFVFVTRNEYRSILPQ